MLYGIPDWGWLIFTGIAFLLIDIGNFWYHLPRKNKKFN